MTMTLAWDTTKLLQLVGCCFQQSKVDNLRQFVASVKWKLAMAFYHEDQAEGALQIFPSNGKEEFVEATRLILLDASGSKEARKFREAQFVSEAHVISFAQCLHSIADIMAQIIYHGLDIENQSGGKIAQRDRNLAKVRDKLQRLAIAPGVENAVKNLLNSKEYKYLRAYVNTTKHFSLLESSYSVNFPDRKHGIRIKSFNYKLESTEFSKGIIVTH